MRSRRTLPGRRGRGGCGGSGCLVVPSPHGIVFWVGRRRPLASRVHATAVLLRLAVFFVTVVNRLVACCSVCSAVSGFRGPVWDDAAGVEERLLGQGDRVAQLLLDGGLRGAQRRRQVDAVAVLRVQLRAGARGVRVRGRAREEQRRAEGWAGRTPS